MDKQEYHMNKKHCLSYSAGHIQLPLLISDMGDYLAYCNDHSDEYIALSKWHIADNKYTVPRSIECSVLKAHIQSPSLVSTIEKNRIILFRQYCDTIWQLSKGFDELLCDEWKCSKDEYQCLTRHCIRL
jgi:hypothetical protein